MKKIMKFIMSVAMVAMALTACDKEFDGAAEIKNDGFSLTVVADNIARTEYDADLMDIKWSEGDKAQVLVKGTYANCTAAIDADNAQIASFTWNPGTSIKYVTAGTRIVQGFYPSSAYATASYDASGDARTRATIFGLNLPANQSATTATFDKNADILVANDMAVEITEEDITAGEKSVGNFKFNRMVAISEFTYKVTNEELFASEDLVTSVSFQVVSEGKYLAGSMYVESTETEVNYVDENIEVLTDNKDYFYASKSDVVTVTLTDKPALKDGFTAWVVTSPVTLSADDKLVFTIKTDKGTTITKTINAVGKDMTFSRTKLNKMSVTLNDAIEIESTAGLSTATLTNADIIAFGKSQAYADSATTITAADGSEWGFKGYRQNASDNYLQIKSDNSTTPYVQLPTVEGEIQKIIFSVGSTNVTSAGGNGKALYLRSEIGGENIASGTGDSQITLEVAGKGLASGFIEAAGALRIFDITVYYDPSIEVKPAPVLMVVAEPDPAAAEGETIVVELKAENLTEDIQITVDADWLSASINSDNNLEVVVEETDLFTTREADITLTADGLEVTVRISQSGKANASESWVRVTSLNDITEGTYVIVAKNSNKVDCYCPNSTFYSSTHPSAVTLASVNVTVDGDELKGAISDDMKWDFSGTNSAMSIKKHNTTDAYLYVTGTNNGVWVGSTNTSNWKFTATGSNFLATYNSQSRCLGIYQSQDWRSYKNTALNNYANTNGEIRLYKLTTTGGGTDEPETPVTPTQLTTPTVTTEVEGNVVTVSWNAVANATSYDVTCGSQSKTDLTGTSTTFTMGWDATYEVNVVAKSTDANYTDSEAGTTTAIVGADPNAGGGEGGEEIILNEEFDNTSTSDSSTAISTSTFANFSGATDKAYKSQFGGIKLGSKSAQGYITSKSLDLSKAFIVKIDACKYGSDTGNIQVTVNGVTKTIANSSLQSAGTFTTFTLEFDAATATSTIKIATSSKRAYIDNVVVSYK